MKLFKKLIILSVFSLLALPAFGESDSGSTGTGGGGNDQISFEAALPSEIQVDWELRFVNSTDIDPIIIGTKRSWGIIPMDDYAQTLMGSFHFRKDALDRGKVGIENQYWAKSSRKTVELSSLPPHAQSFRLDYLLGEMSPGNVRVAWDGKLISKREVLQKFSDLAKVATLMADFEKPESFRNISLADQFFMEIFGVQRVGSQVEENLKTFLRNELEQLRALALSAVGQDDRCDQAQYELFLHRWNGFKVGTKAYFEEVALVGGYQFSSATIQAARILRSAIRGEIYEAVDQYCIGAARAFVVDAE